jgi:uridine phosphorylase
LALGELIIVTAALAADGASRALGASGPVPANPELVERLRAVDSAPEALVVSSDLFYDERPGIEAMWAADGAVAVEMECATLFALAGARRARAAAVLIVSDLISRTRARIGADRLHAAEIRAGELAAQALSGLATA